MPLSQKKKEGRKEKHILFTSFVSETIQNLLRLNLFLVIHNLSASQNDQRLGWPVPPLHTQSHEITQCALRGANSSHKMLKHYLGGLKQLDSLESEPSGQAATGTREGGRERNGRETELCELH